MRRRLRLTGFARFFIVMMFVIPLAYLGASYYRGEDGIQNIKKLLGIGKEPSQQEDAVAAVQEAPESVIVSEKPEQTLETRVAQLEKDNAELRTKVMALETELRALKESVTAAGKSGKK